MSRRRTCAPRRSGRWRSSRPDRPANQRATTESSRMIVSSRSDPVETIAAGTPLTSSSRGCRRAPRPAARRSAARPASAPSSPASSRRPARSARAAADRAGNSVSTCHRRAIAGADLDLLEAVEHVELGQRERVEAVDARARSARDRVVPAAAARPAGRRAVLLAALAQPIAQLAGQLGRQRPFADARRVGLGHAEHAVDRARRHAEAGADAADRGVRRGDERIGAVIDVEQRALRAFEQHRLPVGASPASSSSDDVARSTAASARRSASSWSSTGFQSSVRVLDDRGCAR